MSSQQILYCIYISVQHYLQVYEPGKGLAFHFDKDEHAMEENHQMIQPVLSSVLYLTGDCTTERLGEQALTTRNCRAAVSSDSASETACQKSDPGFLTNSMHGVVQLQ